MGGRKERKKTFTFLSSAYYERIKPSFPVEKNERTYVRVTVNALGIDLRGREKRKRGPPAA